MDKHRYILIVWFHDHWSVSFTTDDKAELESVFIKVPGGFEPMMVDMEEGEVI